MRNPSSSDVAFLFLRHGELCARFPVTVLCMSVLSVIVLSWPVLVQLWSTVESFAIRPAIVRTQQQIVVGSSKEEIRALSEFIGGVPHLRLEQISVDLSHGILENNCDDSISAISKGFLLDVLDLQLSLLTSTVELDTGNGKNMLLSLSDICFSLNGSSCLFHSPLEFWLSNRESLAADSAVQRTISNNSKISSFGIPMTAESVFGGVGVQFPSPTQYATSAFLFFFLDESKIEKRFSTADGTAESKHWGFESNSDITSKVWNDLRSMAVEDTTAKFSNNSHKSWSTQVSQDLQQIFSVFYAYSEPEDDFLTVEFVIVVLSYIIVFFYISLVLGRVELVKSKFSLGLGAIFMVLSSLAMSVGLMSTLGITTSLVPWEVFPFLIISIGVENIFVMTNAVVTTSVDLPVRKRVGLGLSKVGGRMIQRVGSELFLLVLVSMVNVPALQEFCLFATVGVVIDFMMQITFFSAILSVHIRRLELSDLNRLHSAKRTSSSSVPGVSESLKKRTGVVNQWRGAMVIAIFMLASLWLYGPSGNLVSLQSAPQEATTSGHGSLDARKTPKTAASAMAEAAWPVLLDALGVSDLYLDIHPAFRLTLKTNDYLESLNENAFENDGREKQSESLQEILSTNRNQFTWTIRVDGYTLQVPRSVFILAVVSMVGFACLIVIFGMPLVAMIVLDSEDVGKSLSEVETVGDILEERLQCAITSLYAGSAFADVQFIAADDDGTICWSCGDGIVHIWNSFTAFQTAVSDRLLRSSAGQIRRFSDSASASIFIGSHFYLGSVAGTICSWHKSTGNFGGYYFSSNRRDEIGMGVVMLSCQDNGSEQLLLAARSGGFVDACVLRENSETPSEFLWRVCSDTITCIAMSRIFIVSGTTDREILKTNCVTNLTESLSLRMPAKATCVDYSSRFDIAAMGSEHGDILILRVSEGKEILFLKSTKQNIGKESRRDSSDRLFDSRNDSAKLLGLSAGDGHAGQITFLKIVDCATSDGPETSVWLVSAGVDFAVNVWRLTFSKRDFEGYTLSYAQHIQCIQQPGCVIATCYESVVVGARRRCINGNGERTTNNQISAGLEANREFVWEIWLLDISAAEERNLRIKSVPIGEDSFTDVSLEAFAHEFLGKYEAKLQFLSEPSSSRRVSALDKSFDDEWEDTEVEGTDWTVADDPSEDDVPLLPVVGLDKLVVTRWGVVCGFGNYVKVVMHDIEAMRERRGPVLFRTVSAKDLRRSRSALDVAKKKV
ncbi:hypothetical protein HDU84_003747 [Entophlyctis sp. JEL0112]|nr:hypothetical protein HDU84_003747 [Entophlyctis sp. JEL0112]